MTAFMYYSTEMRPKLKEENPDLSFGDLAKLVGQKYKELSEDDKAVYEAKANNDKKRYKEEMAQYNSKGSNEVDESDGDDDDNSDSD